jgi:hypothetical protein
MSQAVPPSTTSTATMPSLSPTGGAVVPTGGRTGKELAGQMSANSVTVASTAIG